MISALTSIKNQNYPHNLFEVIVVKNFEDEETDRFIKDSGFASLLVGEKCAGEMILLAFMKSRGVVICLLDDDDVFSNDKLERVSHVFSEYPGCGYYHNHHSVIDENSADLPFEVRDAPPDSIWFENSDTFLSSFHKLSQFTPDFNLSSISVARAVIENHLIELSNMQAATDTTFMILGIDSDLGVYLDNRRLTRYRIHGSTSATLNQENLASGKSAEELMKRIVTLQFLYNSTRKLKLRRLIAQRLVESQLKMAVLCGVTTPTLRLKDLISFLESAVYQKQRYKGLLFIYYLVSRLNMELGRKMYLKDRFSRQKFNRIV